MDNSYLPKLENFLSDNWRFPYNSYINHINFSSLYLRKSNYYIKIGEEQGRKYINVIQIANIETNVKNIGNFSKLIKEIKLLQPNKIIIVENVFYITNFNFPEKLKHLKFEEFNIQPECSNFVLWVG